jgi:hypothetical protein
MLLILYSVLYALYYYLIQLDYSMRQRWSGQFEPPGVTYDAFLLVWLMARIEVLEMVCMKNCYSNVYYEI